MKLACIIRTIRVFSFNNNQSSRLNNFISINVRLRVSLATREIERLSRKRLYDWLNVLLIMWIGDKNSLLAGI